MEKKDEYGIYLGSMPGKYPKNVPYHGVSGNMGHVWDLSLGNTGDRSQKWDKIRHSEAGNMSHIWGILMVSYCTLVKIFPLQYHTMPR